MPIIGFVLGVVMIAKDRVLDGATVLVISCVAGVLWVALLA